LKRSHLYSALVAAVNISIAYAENTPPENKGIKCYGVAKAGENDCHGTSSDGEENSCPGWSLKDNDPFAWSYIESTQKCLAMGGKLSPPPLPPKKTQATK